MGYSSVMSGSELVTSSSSFYDSYTVGNDEKQFMVPASLAGKDVVFGLTTFIIRGMAHHTVLTACI